jgi:hypothetical protein
VTLLIQAIMQQLQELAKRKGLDGARVASKVNDRGELVVALIISPRYPDEWRRPETEPDGRERKRLSRQERS